MIRKRFFLPPLLCLCAALLITSSLHSAVSVASVKVWQEKIVMPTYDSGAPEPNPLFFFGRQSQGAWASSSLRATRSLIAHFLSSAGQSH